MGRPTEIVLQEKEKSSILFSTHQIRRNDSMTWRQALLSPQEDYLAASFSEYGSIDHFRYVVIDLRKKEVIADHIESNLDLGVWMGRDQLLLRNTLHPNLQGRVYTFKKNGRIHYDSTTWYPVSQNSKTKWALLWNFDGYHIVHPLKNDRFRFQTSADYPQFFGSIDQLFFYRSKIRTDSGVERHIVLAVDAEEASELGQIEPFNHFVGDPIDVIQNAQIDEKLILLTMSRGPQQFIKVLRTDETVVDSIELPSCCSVKKIKYQPLANSLLVEFTSAAVYKKSYLYSFETGWDKEKINREMLQVDEIQLTREIVGAKQDDGTIVPIQLVYDSSIERDSNRPVLIQVYGGWGTEAYFFPKFDHLMIEFLLKKGGILATPAIRGGSIWGGSWHQQGAGPKGKARAIQDTIGSARWLIEQGWTKAGLIGLTGTSNGGMVTASAALQAPEVFGFVAPANGVFDLARYHEFDPYFASNWIQDYGNPALEEDKANLDKISPYVLANHEKLRNPVFLVTLGTEDSRVNPVHAYRFLAKLRENSTQENPIYFQTLKNTGHWLANSWLQKTHAWRHHSVFWTMFYDALGLTF